MVKNFNIAGSSKPLLRRGLGRLPSWLKNKYLLTGCFFIVWMVFFDIRDIASDFGRRWKLKELQKTERNLIQQISDTRKELDLLKTNAQTIEKYAREKYMMKKDNEDLFIVNPPSESN
jgi:hypothetical protein